MKARVFLLLAILLLVTMTGCGKAEESPDSQIIPYQERTVSGRYAEFSKLPVVTSEPDPDGVTFEGVGFGADGDYIMVGFTAPLELAGSVQQGFIYVVDEETKVIYKDIPVMPIVGPLIGRPTKEGQGGYVMLLNYSRSVKSGSVVTVVLGNYKREHVKVP